MLLAALYERVDGIPLMRRYLEAIAIHVWGFNAVFALRAIDSFGKARPIWTDALDDAITPFKSAKAIGTRLLSPSEERTLIRMIERRERVLTANSLGGAGERYVRYHFARSKQFRTIRASRLGYLSDDAGKNRLDVKVLHVSGKRYAISVKNVRDILGTRNTMRWAREVREMARAHSTKRETLTPWLIPAFATDEAVRDCHALGVLCTPISARVAPATYEGTKSTRTALKQLNAVVGPEPFRFVGNQRLHDYDDGFVSRLEDEIYLEA